MLNELSVEPLFSKYKLKFLYDCERTLIIVCSRNTSPLKHGIIIAMVDLFIK